MLSIQNITTTVNNHWQRWVSTTSQLNAHEAFRERMIRLINVILIAFVLCLTIGYIEMDSAWRLPQPIGMLFFVAASLTALHYKRIRVAGWLTTSNLYWMAVSSALQVGFWAFGTEDNLLISIFIAAIILPLNQSKLATWITCTIYVVILLSQYSLVQDLPEFHNRSAVGHIVSVTSMYVMVAYGFYYVFQEFYKREEKYQGLIDTLESRVAARTIDLEMVIEVSRQVAIDLQPDALLQNMTDVTHKAYQLHDVSIFEYNPTCNAFEYRAGKGNSEFQHKVCAEKIEAFLNETYQQRAKTLQEEGSLQYACTLTDQTSSQKDVLLLPLISYQGKMLGCLTLMSEQSIGFVPDEVRVFTLLAQHFAVTMHNAQLYAAQVESNEQLRSIDSIKSQFLATVTHELRTPISIMLNFTEFVSQGLYGSINERQADALNKSIEQGHVLLSQINDLLDMSRLKSGLVSLHVEMGVNLNHELAEISATVAPLLKDKSVVFIEDIDPDLPTLSCDRRRLRQILMNLISNAAKFTEVGSITFSVKKQSNSILIAVIDTGPGIPSADLERIFEPFQQARSGVKQGGTGLGLAISRGLVEAHGGTLTVTSRVGQGSEFYVRLPLHSPIYTLSEQISLFDKELT